LGLGGLGYSHVHKIMSPPLLYSQLKHSNSPVLSVLARFRVSLSASA
jgi:hypothetical protein